MGGRSLALILLVIGGIWWYNRAPSVEAVWEKTKVLPGENRVVYDGSDFSVEWGNPDYFQGDVRYIGRAYNSHFPFLTTDIILTTGEFSDPSLVEIGPVRNSSTSWRAPRRPEGTFVFYHIIPQSRRVLDQLKTIQEGDEVVVSGFAETDGKIRDEVGSFIRVNNDNHKIVLATAISKR